MPSRHRTESRTSPRRLAVVEKQRQALELRKAGVTFQEIADALGYATAQGALLAVESGLRKTLQQPADELRKIDLERLETMLRQVWPFVIAPTVKAMPIGGGVAMQVWDDAKFHATGTVLTILARRAKLLGLDAKDPAPGGSRDNPVWVQDTGAIDLSTATDPELDEFIEKAKAIQEAGRILKQA